MRVWTEIDVDGTRTELCAEPQACDGWPATTRVSVGLRVPSPHRDREALAHALVFGDHVAGQFMPSAGVSPEMAHALRQLFAPNEVAIANLEQRPLVLPWGARTAVLGTERGSNELCISLADEHAVASFLSINEVRLQSNIRVLGHQPGRVPLLRLLGLAVFLAEALEVGRIVVPPPEDGWLGGFEAGTLRHALATANLALEVLPRFAGPSPTGSGTMDASNRAVHGLWIGPALSTLEQMSLRSFLSHGHEVHLWAYATPRGVPDRVIVEDAREILPESAVFKYPGGGSYAGFANMFRYKLLFERGGWWTDLDMVCLRPFDFAAEHVFATERGPAGEERVATSVIKAPAGSASLGLAWRHARDTDPATLQWGETGPALLAHVVRLFGLEHYRQRPDVFCPLDHLLWDRVLDAHAEMPGGAATYAIHLWNEKWRRSGREKDATYPHSCPYERLKARYRDGAAGDTHRAILRAHVPRRQLKRNAMTMRLKPAGADPRLHLPSNQVLSQVMATLEFDLDRLACWDLEHKLIQARTIESFLPGLLPRTWGLGEWCARNPGVAPDPNRFVIKRTLGSGSGESVARALSQAEREHILHAATDRAAVEPIQETWLVQERLSITEELRLYSVEDRAVSALSDFRYREGSHPALFAAADRWLEDSLAKLPAALVGGTMLAWDVAWTDLSGFRAIEINIVGNHRHHQPGFHGNGFFDDEPEGPPRLSCLLQFLKQYYGLDVDLSAEIESLQATGNQLHASYFERLRQIAFGTNVGAELRRD